MNNPKHYPIEICPMAADAGRFVAPVPKSLHTRLVARAEQEGVSMNTLMVSIIAEGVGARTHG